METKDIILLVISIILVVLAMFVFIRYRRDRHNEQFYDSRWRIYHSEDTEED